MKSFNEHQHMIGMSGSGKSRLAVETLVDVEYVAPAHGNDHLPENGDANACGKKGVEAPESKIEAPRPYTRPTRRRRTVAATEQRSDAKIQ